MCAEGEVVLFRVDQSRDGSVVGFISEDLSGKDGDRSDRTGMNDAY